MSIILFFSIISIIIQFVFLKAIIYMNIIVCINVSLSLFSGILTFIINPGIIYSEKDKNENENEKIYCHTCKFLYPKNNKRMEHCYTCNICICNYDHHCGVIGKCVGKYNFFLFIIFVLSSFAFVFTFAGILFNCMQKNFEIK